MKKTKLFTSIAALALVLGLGACDTTSEEEDTPEESEGTTETESGDAGKTTPEGGEGEGGETTPAPEVGTYFLGFNVDGTTYYIDGTTQSAGNYRGEVTAEIGYAVPVTLAAADGDDAYYLTFELDEATYYVCIIDTGSHVNLQYLTTATPIYWDEVNATWVNEEDTYFLCYNGTYKCAYASDFDSWWGTSPVGELFDIPEGWEPEEPQEEEPVTLPEGAYRLGVADIKAATYRYFTGISSSAGQTSTSWNDGVDVYLETEVINGVTGYAFRYISGEYTDYIAYNGSSTGLKYATEPYYWGYDSEHDAYVDNVSGNSGRFLGIQDGFEVIRAYATSNYPSTTNPYGYYIATLYSEYPEALEPLPEVEVPTLEIATSITSGSEYYLGYESDDHGLSMFNGTSWDNKALYVSYEETFSAWVKVTATGDETNGYALTFTDSSSVNQTIYGWKSGNYLDLGYAKTDGIDSTIANVSDGASKTFKFDAINNGLTTTFGSTTYYIGVNASYANEIAIFSSSSSNTWCHLYTEAQA